MTEFSLSQIGKIVTGKTPKTRCEHFFGGETPFVTPSDMDDRRIIFSTKRSLSEDGVATVKNNVIPANAVMVSCIGSDMGKTYLSGTGSVTNQQINTLIVDEQRFSPLFVYYNLFGRRAEIREMAAGAAQPILNKTDFGKIIIDTPSLSEQREIAAILGALDDKIELNRKTAATLEEMARALYKSWFVDFDAVIAKSEGRPPAFMNAETAALFPDRFGDDGLPDGWEFLEAQTLLDISIGKTPPRKEPEHFTSYKDGVPWLSIKDMGSTGPYTGPTSEGLFQSAVDRFNVKIAPKGTALLSFKLTVGRVCIAREDICTNEAIAHMKCRPESSISNTFVFWYLKMFDFESLASTSSIATAVNSKTIKAMPFLLPDIHIITAFDSMVDPAMKKLLQIMMENQTLAELRDTLLPKLMSGELRVGEAKEQVEDVA